MKIQFDEGKVGVGILSDYQFYYLLSIRFMSRLAGYHIPHFHINELTIINMIKNDGKKVMCGKKDIQ